MNGRRTNLAWCDCMRLPTTHPWTEACDTPRTTFNELGSQPGEIPPLKKVEPGKLRFDLIPPEVEYALAAVLTYGATKHGDRGWEQHLTDPDFYDQIYAALRRHLHDDRVGKLRDSETDMLHLSHAFCCLAFLLTWRIRRSE